MLEVGFGKPVGRGGGEEQVVVVLLLLLEVNRVQRRFLCLWRVVLLLPNPLSSSGASNILVTSVNKQDNDLEMYTDIFSFCSAETRRFGRLCWATTVW